MHLLHNRPNRALASNVTVYRCLSSTHNFENRANVRCPVLNTYEAFLATAVPKYCTHYLHTYISFNKVLVILCNLLKYGFCNNSFRKRWTSDQLNTFTTYLSSLLGVIAIDKYVVKVVKGSSFRNHLLQNPYFRCVHWAELGTT